METKSTATAVKSVLSSVFTKRNGIAASLVCSVFAAGAHFGFEQYENTLEASGLDTLPKAENIFAPVTEEGEIDWVSIKEDSIKIATFDFD